MAHAPWAACKSASMKASVRTLPGIPRQSPVGCLSAVKRDVCGKQPNGWADKTKEAKILSACIVHLTVLLCTSNAHSEHGDRAAMFESGHLSAGQRKAAPGSGCPLPSCHQNLPLKPRSFSSKRLFRCSGTQVSVLTLYLLRISE